MLNSQSHRVRRRWTLALTDEFGNRTASRLPLKTKFGKAPRKKTEVRVASLGFNPTWLTSAPGEGPRIDLEMTSPQRVYQSEFPIDGRVSDSSGVQLVTVNDEALPLEGGRDLLFSRIVGPFETGTHRFEIAAANTVGDERSMTLTVDCKIPTELQSTEKLTVAIPPFELVGEPDTNTLADRLKDYSYDEIRDRKRFEVVQDRDRMSEIWTEIIISQREGSERRFSQLNLVPADLILDGVLQNRVSTITLSMYILSVQSGRVEGRVEVHGADKSPETLKQMGRALAQKIELLYPAGFRRDHRHRTTNPLNSVPDPKPATAHGGHSLSKGS